MPISTRVTRRRSPIRLERQDSPPGTNYCGKCKQYKSLDKFSFSKTSPNGKRSQCKECVKAKPDKYRPLRAKWYKYGLSADRYRAMLDAQNGVCAICGNPESRIHKGVRATLSVDHDHATGEVRGLLCFSCNSVLGYAKDNPTILSKAIDYLMEAKS